MIDQSLIQSGFDAEILFGARYIKYILLNAVETGSFPLNINKQLYNEDTGQLTADLSITIHPPEDYERVYTPNPAAETLPSSDSASFDVKILFDDPANADIKLTILADIIDTISGQNIVATEINLFTSFQLLTDEDENGNQSNARINIELLDIDGIVIDIIVLSGQATKQEILDGLKEEIDRTTELGLVGENQNVQNIFMQKMASDDDHDDAMGLYINLKLKDGPEDDSFFGDRGDLINAVNFLPTGQDIAFGMPAAIYEKLGNDAFQRMAEETSDGSGVFTYPLHENPTDKSSDVKGKIKSILIYPGADNTLLIDVHGEYELELNIGPLDIAPDPDFHLYITVTPSITDGIISWELDYKVDLSPFLEIASFVLTVILTAIFGPGGLLTGGIIFGLIFTAQEFVVEPIATAMVSEQADGMVDVSVFNAIPNRVTIETKRWDPFYKTLHQIVAKTSGVQINISGIGFSGVAALDKQPYFITDVVIRDEVHSQGNVGLGFASYLSTIDSLFYRVKDYDNAANDFESEFPATDRLSFLKVTDLLEDNLFQLTLTEIQDRIQAAKLIPVIPYTAEKVYIRNNQVEQILVISNQEIKELKSSLKSTFKADKKAEIENTQTDTLTEEATDELTDELGETPTDEQISARVDEKIDELVDEALDEYINEELDSDLQEEIYNNLRFDLAPEEMAGLQFNAILFLQTFVVIFREGVPYYRDRADYYKPDNLMSLPRYSPLNT